MEVKLRYFLEKDFQDYQQLTSDETLAAAAGMRIIKNAFEKWMAFRGVLGRPGFIAIVDSEDHLIGGIFLFNTEDGYELGYLLLEQYWNQGIMTKAVKTFLQDFARRIKAPVTIKAKVFVDNLASKKVLEKNGFQAQPGTQMNLSSYDQELRPEIQYELRLFKLE